MVDIILYFKLRTVQIIVYLHTFPIDLSIFHVCLILEKKVKHICCFWCVTQFKKGWRTKSYNKILSYS